MREVHILNSLGVSWIVHLSDGVVHSESVVISHMLLGSPSDTIMMLVYPKAIHHRIMCLQDTLHSKGGRLYIQDLQRVKLIGSMQACLAITCLRL